VTAYLLDENVLRELRARGNANPIPSEAEYEQSVRLCLL
jgi:hypothetical protein